MKSQVLKSGFFKAFKVFTLFKLAMLTGCEVETAYQNEIEVPQVTTEVEWVSEEPID